MSAFDFRVLVEQLGRELVRRGLQDEARALRDFYARQVKVPPPERGWTVDVVLEWMARLQIGPLGTVYRVLHNKPMRCPFCNIRQDAKETFLVETSWDGGAKMRCTRCKGGWVQLEK